MRRNGILRKELLLLLILILLLGCGKKNIDRVYHRAHKLAQQAKHTEAIEYLEKYIVEHDRDDKYFYYHGLFLELQSVEYNLSVYKKDYQKAYEINPDKYVVLLSLGSAYALSNLDQEAVVLLEKAVEKYTNKFGDLTPYSILSSCYMKLEEHDKAQITIEKELLINPNHSWCYMDLGIIYANKGDLEKFREYYLKAFDLNPEDKLLHNAYGNELIKLGYFEKARLFYKLLVEQNPNFYFCNADLGYLELLNENFEKAHEYFDKSLSYSPTDPATLMYLSFSYYLQGDYSKALEYYRDFRRMTEMNIPLHIIRNETGRSIRELEDFYERNSFFKRIKLLKDKQL